MKIISPETLDRQEALEHLRTTYAHVLYYEPWTENNKRRLAAVAKKFWAFKALGPAPQKAHSRTFVFKPRAKIARQPARVTIKPVREMD